MKGGVWSGSDTQPQIDEHGTAEFPSSDKPVAVLHLGGLVSGTCCQLPARGTL